MSSILSVLVVALFALWILATVAQQIPVFRPIFRERDVGLLVPEYRFFAPNPIQGDFHLLFRDIYTDGTAGAWTEVCRLRRRRLLDAIWHPEKRERKALFDAINQLAEVRIVGVSPTQTLLLTPYLLILNYVTAIPRSLPAEFTQFEIMYSYGWGSSRPPAVFLISERHRLGALKSGRPGRETVS